VNDRVYVLAFAVQMVMVMGIIYAALLYTSVAAPETSVFVIGQKPEVGFIGSYDVLVEGIGEELNLVEVSGEPRGLLENTNLVAVLVVPETLEDSLAGGESAELTLFLDNTNVLSGYADEVVEDVVEGLSRDVKLERLSLGFEDPEAIIDPIQITEIRTRTRGEPSSMPPEFVEIMYGLLIPFIVLLPTFLSTNMMSDSIVGEKERGTLEGLFASPLSRLEVILGKSIPIVAIAVVQAVLWLLLLQFRGVVIYNTKLLMLFLFALDLAFIGFGILISALSDNLKESNLYVTVLLILASLAFFVPLSVKRGLYAFSPVYVISKLASNPAVPFDRVYLTLAVIFSAGILATYIAAILLGTRDQLRL